MGLDHRGWPLAPHHLRLPTHSCSRRVWSGPCATQGFGGIRRCRAMGGGVGLCSRRAVTHALPGRV